MSENPLQILRSQMLQKRRALSGDFVVQASRSLAKRVTSLTVFSNATRIASYSAFNNEVDPSFITDAALRAGKKVYWPIVGEEKTLHFAPFSNTNKLSTNRYGISEPVCNPGDRLLISAFDLILVPLVCFDKNCNRIGMGAGYYDRCLAETTENSPVKIGLAYEMQRIESVSINSWDIPMDLIITEENIYRRNNR